MHKEILGCGKQCFYTHCDTVEPYTTPTKLKALSYICPMPNWHFNSCSNKYIDTRTKKEKLIWLFRRLKLVNGK